MLYERIVSGPAIDRAREGFYRRRHACRTKTCRLSFERLLEIFDNPSLTQLEMAAIAGISSTAIHRLYENHFQHLYGGRSLTERHRAYQVRMKTQEKRQHQLLDQLPWTRFVREGAASAGYSVSPVVFFHKRENGKSDRRVSKCSVLISGRHCMVRPITNSYLGQTPDAPRHGRVQLHRARLAETDACLLPILLPGDSTDLTVLVIPSSVLMQMVFQDHPEMIRKLYVPLRGLDNPGRLVARLDPYKYDNRWDLIPGAKKMSASP